MIVSRKMAEEARATLEMAPSLEQIDEAFIKMMYRLRAIEHHPDKGGDAAKFAAVDRAKHVLLAWLARSGGEHETKPHGGVSACPRCNGQGWQGIQHGFKQTRFQCPTCNGAGEIFEQEKEGDRFG